jgi:hypothetical protein
MQPREDTGGVQAVGDGPNALVATGYIFGKG